MYLPKSSTRKKTMFGRTSAATATARRRVPNILNNAENDVVVKEDGWLVRLSTILLSIHFKRSACT